MKNPPSKRRLRKSLTARLDRSSRRQLLLERLETRAMLAANLDFGDAPDLGPGYGPGDYATTAADNGPSHEVSSALYIGTGRPDPDAIANPSVRADGDDNNTGTDDEDGVRNPILDLNFTVTSHPSVSLLVTNRTGNQAATLHGWIDFNGDGVFDNQTEYTSAPVVGPPTANNEDPQPEDGYFENVAIELQFPQLLTSFHGTTYARFRLALASDQAAASPVGPAGIGEVEDYVAQIHRPSTGLPNELQYYQTDALYDEDRNKFTRPFVSGMHTNDYALGTSVVSIGDLDDNEVGDLAVAVPGANMDGDRSGAVHVFFMEEDGSYSKRAIIGLDSDFGVSTENAGFWLRLASLGDFNDDGINEIAISHGYGQQISLSVLSLKADGTANSVKTISSDAGIPVGHLGDLDGDGTTELAVKNPFEVGSFQILSLNSQVEIVSTSNINHGEAGGESPDENDNFGMSVAPVGNLDGEGVIDLAVGVQRGGLYDAGQVQTLFLDRTTDGFVVARRTELMSSNDDASEGFGNAIAAIGDLDGDDITDLVIGDPTLRERTYPDGQPTNALQGAAYVVFLNEEGTVKGFGPDILQNFSPTSRSERYATSIELLGDLSGDGAVEIAIGAPGFAKTGAVDIVSLTPEGTAGWTGSIGPFGTRGQSTRFVTSVGDIDGNGYQDMAVKEGGGIQILLFGADGQVIATEEISAAASGIGSFGTVKSLASAGDLDGDGIQELAVGTPSFVNVSRFSEDANGVVRILFLNADGSLRDFTEVHPVPNIGPDEHNNDPAYLNYGQSVTSPGDLNGDGIPDLLVSQAGYTRRRPVQLEDGDEYYVTDQYPASIDVLLMDRDGSILRRETNIETGYSRNLAAVGDINRDGFPDIVAATPGIMDVFFLGQNGELLSKVTTEFPADEANRNLGLSVSRIGDLDADGVPEVMIGGIRDDIGQADIVYLHANGTIKARHEVGFPLTMIYRGQAHDVSPLGDVDGDGVVDFAMASPPRNSEQVPEGGLFVIGLEERRLGDFGDAPDTGPDTGAFNYQTLGEDDGPFHFVDPRVRLGQMISDDIDDKASPRANQDDDDGVVDPTDLHITGVPEIDISVTNQTAQEATLHGWIDFNFDGSFAVTEYVSAVVSPETVDEIVTLQFPEFPAGISGTTYARFRLTTDETVSLPTGPAEDGEVEDYLVTIETPPLFVGVGDVFDLTGPGTAGRLGRSIASLGDLDSNGVDDYAVGFNQGNAVRILLMATDEVVGEYVTHQTTGYDRWSTFGVSVASLGDLDGDGVTDIAVGANKEQNAAGSDTGALHILFLNADGTEKSRTVITDGVSGGPTLFNDDGFGSSVAVVGDLNEDEIVDLAVGADNDNQHGSRLGAMYILFMNRDGTVQSYSKIGHYVGGGPALTGFANFGTSVAALGHWDDDHIPDIAVGADEKRYRDDTGNYRRSGAVYLITLNANGTAKNVTELNRGSGIDIDSDDYFGSSITAVGDLDGNGVTDIAVGARHDEPGNFYGAVHIALLNEDGTVKDSIKIGDELNGGPDLNYAAAFAGSLVTLPIQDESDPPKLAIGAVNGGVYVAALTEEFQDFGDAPMLANADIGSSQNTVFDLQVDFDGVDSASYEPIGDINDDGIPDFAGTFSEPFQSGPWIYTRYGLVTMLMNADGTVADVQQYLPDLTWANYTGARPEPIGDLDGDGVPDIALSYKPKEGHGVGEVHLLFMNIDGSVRESAVVHPQLIPGLRLETRDVFGTAVTSMGDLDDDGTIDLAISSVGRSSGEVYVMFMNPDGSVQDWHAFGYDAAAQRSRQRELQGDFGASLSSLGDLDGDGVPDLLVGAPKWPVSGQLVESGAAFVMFMKRDGDFHAYQRITYNEGLPLSEGNRFGSAVLNAGDLDDDDVTDIIVGATHDIPVDSETHLGALHVVLLNSDGTIKATSKISSNSGGGPESAAFGQRIASLGDRDGDGLPELLVGSQAGPLVIDLVRTETDYPEATSKRAPSHERGTSIFLGSNVDYEPRSSANSDAVFDDNTLPFNDANGLIDPTQLSNFVAGSPVVIDVLATNLSDSEATVYGWIDFNGNNQFDIGERNLLLEGEGQPLATVAPGSIGTTVSLKFPAQPIVVEGDTYARFRISTDPAATAPTGHAMDGEVEDYRTSIVIIDTDYGDAPDTGADTGPGNYNTLSTDSGPSHLVNENLYLGLGADVELEAKSIDTDDGLVSPSVDLNLVPGQEPVVRVSVTNETSSDAFLYGWIDYLADGEFGSYDRATHVVIGNAQPDDTLTIPARFSGEVELLFRTVPDQALGNTYARFRLSADPAVSSPTGPAADGEVEDYKVTILANDYSDAPATYATASHFVLDGLSIGTTVDRELNVNPSPDSNSDDVIGIDDEDGFDASAVFLSPGEAPTLTIQVTKPEGLAATLYGWIDSDGDGFADEETAVKGLEPSQSGTFDVDLKWSSKIPEGSSGLANVRFRISTDDLSGQPGDHASDGEVEDHEVLILNVDLGDAPDPAGGTSTGNYRTRLEDGGPSHSIDPDLYLGGPVIDNESESDQFVTDENGDLVLDKDGDPIQRLSANGDDVTPDGGVDDEDGLFDAGEDLKLKVGELPEVRIIATNLTNSMATVHGWIDFNKDGDFDDDGEHTFRYVPSGEVSKEVTLFFFPQLGSDHLGTTYARFRLTTDYVVPDEVSPDGYLEDGEVEDYVVTMSLPTDPELLATKSLKLLQVDNSMKATSRLGASLADLNDYDGDGGSDFLVGAPSEATSAGRFTLARAYYNPDIYYWTEDVTPLPQKGRFWFIDREDLWSADYQAGLDAQYDSGLAKTITDRGDKIDFSRFADPFSGDLYGHSLARIGSMVVVGIPGESYEAESKWKDKRLTRQDVIWQRSYAGEIEFRKKDSTSIATESFQQYAPDNLSSGDRFGWSVANVGDINGDEIDDLAVGAPGDGPQEQGAIYILFMKGNGTVDGEPVKINRDSARMPALSSTARFGTSVAGLADGVIAVGTTEDGGRGSIYIIKLDDHGSLTEDPIRIWSGTDGLGPLQYYQSLGIGEGFGRSVMRAPDLDGNGVDDLLVGSPRYGGTGAFRAIYLKSDFSVNGSDVFSSTHSELSPVLNEEFGTSIAVLSEPDNAGRFEIVVGAPGYNDDDGRVWRMTMQTSVTPETLDDVVLSLPDDEKSVNTKATSANLDDWVAAIADLPEFPRPNEIMEITFTVEASVSQYKGQNLSVPPGYKLVISGSDEEVTFTGASPALTVTSGDVVFDGDFRFVNPTDTPTIRVLDGSLTLRGVEIQESTAGDQPAIEVLGGRVDLGTAEDPGGNTIIIHGEGDLISNAGPNPLAAIGNTFQRDGTPITSGFEIEEEITDYLERQDAGLVSYLADNLFDSPVIDTRELDLSTLVADLNLASPAFTILEQTNGQAELLGDGQTVRFNAYDLGEARFRYSVHDGGSEVATRTVHFDVTNLPPEVAVDAGEVEVNAGESANHSGTFADTGEDNVQLSASIGSVVKATDGSGTWLWSLAPEDLPAESQTVTITATDHAGVSSQASFTLTVIPATSPLSVTNVSVNNGDSQRSNTTELAIEFDRAFDAQQLIDSGQIVNAVTLHTGTGDGTAVNLTADRFRWDDSTQRLLIDLTSGIPGTGNRTLLLDGRYELRIDGQIDPGFNDTDGTDDGIHRYQFHQLRGDFDGDAVVGLSDRATWFDRSKVVFGARVGMTVYDATYDFDGDGIISTRDYYVWLYTCVGTQLD
jgi:hypothetical protein